MSAIVTIAIILTLVSAASMPAVLLVDRQGRKKALRSGRDHDRERRSLSPDVLADPRSCLQVGLTIFDQALQQKASGHTSKAARQLLNLLRASPLLVFSEIIDDHVLAKVENTTSAKRVWIVSSDESIEFEYPAPGTSFVGAVFNNLERGVIYRYLVPDTDNTRVRAMRLEELAKERGLEQRLQIRFLPDRYWIGLRSNTDQMVVFDGEDSAETYYLFPGSGVCGTVRRWIRAPFDDAESNVRDMDASWQLAAVSDRQSSPNR